MAFAHSHGFRIDTFNAESHSHNHFHGRRLDPLKLLRDARAVEATHTSKAAAYAPKCKPGSRAKVVQDIRDWVGEEDARTTVLWFSGPVGGGKTCITREVVAQCEMQGFVIASYFFSTRVAGLDNEAPFVATIAHQLCMKSPLLEEKISQAILSYPDIFKESQEFQAERLLLSSILSLDDLSAVRIVVVFDGLDECRDSDERIQLIRVLRRLATSSQNLRVIVASRPEVDIRTEFASPDNRSITHFLRLHDYDGTTDIRDYLCDEFCSIRDTHPAKDSIPPDWPVEKTLNILVQNSSGSYIYPSTVVKHVRNPRRHPVAMLEEVVSLQVAKSNPFAELDTLYCHILHPPHVDIPMLRRLLHCVMGLSDDSDRAPVLSPISSASAEVVTPTFVDDLLSLPIGTTSTTFCDLHSLISVPFQDDHSGGPLRFHHKSLEDYLYSPERSGDLYQPIEETRICLTEACIFYLQTWLNRASLSTPNLLPRTPALQYSQENWVTHLYQLFLTLSRKNEPGSDLLSLFPKSITSFDPVILWRISSISEPHSRGRLRLILDIGDIQRQLHVLICTLSVGGRRPFNGMDQCFPICARASHLLKISNNAQVLEAYLKGKGRPTSESAEDIEGASYIFQTEVDDSVASALPSIKQRQPGQSGNSSIPVLRQLSSSNAHRSATSSTAKSVALQRDGPSARPSTAPIISNRLESLSLSPRSTKHYERPKLGRPPSIQSRLSPTIKLRPKSAIPDPVRSIPSTCQPRATTSLGRRSSARPPAKEDTKKPEWRL